MEDPTMSLSSRIVLGSGQKKIEVHGPFPEIEDELIAPKRFLETLSRDRMRHASTGPPVAAGIYFRPFVLDHGKPYFARTRSPLRLVANDPAGEDAIRRTFVPT
jgi:hypothetical protein